MARENPSWILWGFMAPHDALLTRELMLRGGCRAHEGVREGCGYRDLSAARWGEKPQEGWSALGPLIQPVPWSRDRGKPCVGVAAPILPPAASFHPHFIGR